MKNLVLRYFFPAPLIIMPNRCLIEYIKTWQLMTIFYSGKKMHKEINKLINSMDVKQDREDAEAKAYSIAKFGEDALDLLVQMGDTTSEKSMDTVKKKKILRAIILTLLILIKKNNTLSFKETMSSKAKNLLFKLAAQGYESAKQVIYK